MNTSGLLFGVDIGGSGIKGATVDPVAGELTVKRHRIPTPQPSTPDAVARTVKDVVGNFGWTGAIGVTIPAVVRDGLVMTAANIDDGWIGTNAEELLSATIGSRVRVINDADAAGIAEVEYGSAAGVSGLVIVLTFGTGIGSAMFSNGKLIRNTELGHLEFHGMDAEDYAAARLVESEGLDLTTWSGRVNEYLHHVELVLAPDLFVFGGGISKRFDQISEHLELATPVVAAKLRNNAGIVGAALTSADLGA